jgi:hypothetical protein
MAFLSDTKWKGFKGAARKITEEEIAQEAKALGVTWAQLHGIMEVEAGFRRPGDGFDKEGRPKMLFEPHKFYAALKIRNPARLQEAVRKDLARPSQPPRSWYGNKSYWRLVQAIEIEEVSGLLACSWGFGQVLGSNWKAAGFKNVQDMVAQCMDSERAHLKAMCGFIKSNGLVRAIKTGNAAAFARGYNGRNYAAGGYHTKIANAWAKWRRMPFPQASGARLVAVEPKEVEVMKSNKPTIAEAAEALPPELQPKSRASSTTNIASGVAALFTLIGMVVAGLWPNQSGTWEHWAGIALPFVVSLIGSLVAIKGRSNALNPVSSATATELATIIERERAKAALEATETVERRVEDESDATRNNDDLPSDTIGKSEELEPQRLVDMPLSKLMEQLPELADHFRNILPALATLSVVGEMAERMSRSQQGPNEQLTPPPSI